MIILLRFTTLVNLFVVGPKSLQTAAKKQFDGIYIVMELCLTDLSNLLAALDFPLLEQQIKCIMQHVLRGVVHLHEHKYLHRDIKVHIYF